MKPVEQEKWSVGKTGGCVVSDTVVRLNYSDADRDSDVDYYGGHLVAESIGKKAYEHLIAGAPEMLAALKDALDTLESAVVAGCADRHGNPDKELAKHALAGHHTLVKMRAAIAKAEGRQC